MYPGEVESECFLEAWLGAKARVETVGVWDGACSVGRVHPERPFENILFMA